MEQAKDLQWPPLDFDALRERYARERAVRMRKIRAGTSPYGAESQPPPVDEAEIDDADPYMPPIVREPLNDEVEVAVIGAGLSGLLLGANLRRAGVRSIRVIDKAGDFGGVWYWNRYPGAQCDVESYIYLPLLEEMAYMPSEKYAYQPEILRHCQNIGRRFDLYRDACFQTRVTDVRWLEDEHRWLISTDRGDRMRARFVCMANGPIDKPKPPAIAGIQDFEGHTFHTSRWDYDYTGGGPTGGLVKLRDKRVGVIGTGATAVQCVPHLGESSKHLYVFQRTPSSIAPRNNRPTDPEWAAALEPGWQRRRMENFTNLLSGKSVDDLIQDGWTNAFKSILANPEFESLSGAERSKAAELADFAFMKKLHERVDSIVSDPATRESLKAFYYYFCKRPCFHDTYLQTFQRSNVTLVDTGGEEIERVTRKGVVVHGTEYEVDCLVFATGFEINTSRIRRAGYDVLGVGGRSLADKWANGLSTLFGMMTSGFPNFVFSPGVNSQFGPLTLNFPHALTEFAEHVAFVISHCLRNDIETFDVEDEAEQAWVDTIVQRSARYTPGSRGSIELLKSCVPGYLNNDGRPEDLRDQDASFGGTATEFCEILWRWRNDGGLAGLRLRARDGAPVVEKRASPKFVEVF